jgi:hypothetical protein
MSVSTALPQPDPNGDYSRTGHRHWVVVDPDPEGVAGRWSSDAPTDWYSPSAKFTSKDFASWQVVRRFKRNQSLLANPTPAGFVLMADQNGKPWLKVSLGENEQICLVRANVKHIRPYEP